MLKILILNKRIYFRDYYYFFKKMGKPIRSFEQTFTKRLAPGRVDFVFLGSGKILINLLMKSLMKAGSSD